MTWIFTLSIMFNFLMTVALVRTGQRLNMINEVADTFCVILKKIDQLNEISTNLSEKNGSAIYSLAKMVESLQIKVNHLTKDSEENRN